MWRKCKWKKISWEPIGNYGTDETHIFKGHFDGQEKTISNIYINANTDYQGLFGSSQGIIENINIANGKVYTSNQCTAVLVGENSGTIKNVNIKNGEIIGYWYIGGIAGNNKSTIELCTNEATISHIEEGDFNGWETGGIVGYNYGIISKCINKASIRGTHSTGGICGANDGIVDLSANIGNIIGDLATEKFTTGTNCGGVVGMNGYYNSNSKVLNCYNKGEVKSLVVSSRCGGIIASASGLGGGSSNITNCYNIGNVSGTEYYGGISAYYNGNNTIFINNYWLNTCGAIYGRAYEKSNTNAESNNESEIKALANILGEAYIADGKIKDTNGNWIDNKDEKGNIIYTNNGYPILKWQVTER